MKIFKRLKSFIKDAFPQKCKECNGYGILIFLSEPEKHHLEDGQQIKSDSQFNRIMDGLMKDSWSWPKDHSHPCNDCRGSGKIKS